MMQATLGGGAVPFQQVTDADGTWEIHTFPGGVTSRHLVAPSAAYRTAEAAAIAARPPQPKTDADRISAIEAKLGM